MLSCSNEPEIRVVCDSFPSFCFWVEILFTVSTDPKFPQKPIGTLRFWLAVKTSDKDGQLQ